MRISDWSSDVCSSDLEHRDQRSLERAPDARQRRIGGISARQEGPVEGDADLVLRHQPLIGGSGFGRGGFGHLALGDEVQIAFGRQPHGRSEEHTSELQSLMRISYAVFCLKKKKKNNHHATPNKHNCTKTNNTHTIYLKAS